MHIWFWIVFNAAILILLFLDLTVVSRKRRAVPFQQALLMSAFWIGLAMAFAVFVHQWLGSTKALEFVTGYLLEEALSVDNLFVFILLFAYFKVPPEEEKTVLFWGIIGALIMRGTFIGAGVALVQRFHWILYAFGVFLIYTGFKLMREGGEQQDPSRNVVLKFCRRFLPLTESYEGKSFFVRREGRILATPLFVVLLVVETTDILFATDSIPAILAITRDPFIVYTSNVFAILGLRSLYFALAGLMKLFHYLNYGLAVVLMFIGAKMLLPERYHVPTWVALVVVAGVLALSVLASALFPKKDAPNSEERQA
ncbi:MAG TPA: TerC family protein [Candidatus Elarobacter sp.]|jgi:tellurite resistance protein TerC|nr:TerC family protein [Candidatus Elarobacter sp.]